MKPLKYIVKADRKFPEDEIIRIAYHFINAEGENKVEVVESIDKRKEILRDVEEVLRRVMQFNEPKRIIISMTVL